VVLALASVRIISKRIASLRFRSNLALGPARKGISQPDWEIALRRF
jgi:hypothetical protein